MKKPRLGEKGLGSSRRDGFLLLTIGEGLASRAGYVGAEGVLSSGVAVLTAKH